MKNDQISWEYNGLTYQNFQKKPPRNTISNGVHELAQIKLGNEVRFIHQNQKLMEVEMKHYMEPEKSWMKEKTSHVLAHEQLHFDIAELQHRKLKQAVNQMIANGDNHMRKVQRVIEKFYREGDRLQEQYDNEVFGDSLAFVRWQKAIGDSLTKYQP